MLSRFDEEVQQMDCQDYDLDEIVSNWLLDMDDDELHRHYEIMFQSNSESSSADDGRILCQAVKNLYRRMNNTLRDINRRQVSKIFVNLREETLVVEVT